MTINYPDKELESFIKTGYSRAYNKFTDKKLSSALYTALEMIEALDNIESAEGLFQLKLKKKQDATLLVFDSKHGQVALKIISKNEVAIINELIRL